VSRDDQLSTLLTKTRRTARENITHQRASFALGNGNIEGEAFSRATVTMAVMPEERSKAVDAGVVRSNEQDHRRLELNSMLRQYDLMVDLITRYTGPNSPHFILSPEIIVSLQAVLAYPEGPQPGFRSHKVRIATNDFVPIPPVEIPVAVDGLCSYVNQSWNTSDALLLAAYALWRLNWIHPFGDGNGRTARALSYLILSVKLGGLLPGIPTIPEQLRERRADYFDALAKIDLVFQEREIVDVSPLADLLHTMLVRQLGAVPALASEETTSVHELVDRRVRTAPEAIVRQIYGDVKVVDRLWSLGDHLVLQIGPQEAITKAEAMLSKTDSPFPRLLASENVDREHDVSAGQKILILRGERLDATMGYAFSLEHNAAVTIEQPKVYWHTPDGTEDGWELQGILYIIRLGRDLTQARAAEIFDLLLARHLVAQQQ